jgi:tetratricopeptide (TPR) repeat protein
MPPDPQPELSLELAAVAEGDAPAAGTAWAPGGSERRPALSSVLAQPAAPARWPGWLLAGLIGLFLVLTQPLLSSVWTVNQAGMMLNRGLATADPETDARSRFAEAQAMLEARASGADSAWRDGFKDKAFWRTYGAAASRAPSEAAFLRLVDARGRGALDRVGLLWLAEVAAATGHWGEANEAYLRLDSANLLINRAAEALEDGRRQEARSWLTLAAASVRSGDSRADRPSAAASLDATSPHGSDLLRAPGGRAISLLRLGQGFLKLSYPEEALPLLEEALLEIEVDPPGVLERQSIQLSLGGGRGGVHPPAPPVSRQTSERVQGLVEQALTLGRSAPVLLQAAGILRSVREGAETQTLLREAVERFPHVPETHLSLGALLHQRGRVFLAREVYEDAVKTIPGDVRLQGEYAKMTFLTGAHDKAVSRLERAIEMGSGDVWVYAYLGDAYLRLHRPADARNAYLAAMEDTTRQRWLKIRLQSVQRMERLDP